MFMAGFVEALRRFQVRGWVNDTAAPNQRLRVQVRVQDRIAGTGVADLFRKDLADAGVGDGRHAFVVNVTEMLPLSRPDSIRVETVAPDGTTLIVPMLPEVAIETMQIETQSRMVVSTLRGFFEVTSPYEVAGWAYDSASPDEHVAIEIEVGGNQLGKLRAAQFKPDLVQAGIGRGDHGFTFAVPAGQAITQPEKAAVFARGAAGDRVALRLVEAAGAPPPTAAPVPPLFPGDITDPLQRPVIVLGAARSGTSAMAQALTASGVYAGFEEGHFLDILQPFLQTTAQFYRTRAEEWSFGRSTLLGAVPKRFVDEGLQHILVQAVRLAFPSGKWIDKTPQTSMIAVAPALRRIWPNARFIYMRRRGIENLESRLRKFPGTDFESQCREWSLSIRGWYAVAPQLAGAAMEIDQLYMARHPAEVAVALRGFLSLSDDAVSRTAQALAFDQPERTSSQFGEVADLASLGWPDRYIQTFRAICGEAIALAGYTEGAAYFAGEPAKHGLVLR